MGRRETDRSSTASVQPVTTDDGLKLVGFGLQKSNDTTCARLSSPIIASMCATNNRAAVLGCTTTPKSARLSRAYAPIDSLPLHMAFFSFAWEHNRRMSASVPDQFRILRIAWESGQKRSPTKPQRVLYDVGTR